MLTINTLYLMLSNTSYSVQVREYEVNKWSSLGHEQSPDKTGRVYPHLA